LRYRRRSPPTATQDLLLQASFLPLPAGRAAWEEWRSAANLDDHVDLGSLRLLPYVWRRLRRDGVADPLLEKFAGISRKHWLENRLFFRQLAVLVRDLRECDVDVLIPDGTALALLHYPDYVLDPLINSTVVVSSRQALTAIGRMQAMGWSPIPQLPEKVRENYVAARSWHRFRYRDGREVCLQWHVLADSPNERVDRELWSAASVHGRAEMTVAVLSPTDQLLQTCAQTVWVNVLPLFLRSVDAMLLLSAPAIEIDWDRFVGKVAELGAILPTLDTLSYLQDRLDGPIPDTVVRTLQALPVSRMARMEYTLRSGRARWLARLSTLWCNYRRGADTTLLRSVIRFPRFVQHYLRLNRLWQLPLHAMARTAGRVWKSAR